VTAAVILCGGLARRMCLPRGVPKQLLSLGSESIVGRLCRQLDQASVKRKMVVLPPEQETAVAFSQFTDLRFLRGTGSKAGDLVRGLASASRSFTEIVVVMGDCVFRQDELVRFVRGGYPDEVTSVLAGGTKEGPSGSGVYIVGDVAGYRRERDEEGIVSAGIYLMRSEAARFICRSWDVGENSMHRLMDRCVGRGLRTRRFLFSVAYDVNSPEDYQACLQSRVIREP
jgi:GTP:adenosylcobinamide-phosphate guanylyltransferase